ncbi:hypothetical protein INR49_014168 [Caranx melampygus]|nr:hypothetical protein INR49_014168 [Caranx melampygus]
METLCGARSLHMEEIQAQPTSNQLEMLGLAPPTTNSSIQLIYISEKENASAQQQPHSSIPACLKSVSLWVCSPVLVSQVQSDFALLGKLVNDLCLKVGTVDAGLPESSCVAILLPVMMPVPLPDETDSWCNIYCTLRVQEVMCSPIPNIFLKPSSDRLVHPVEEEERIVKRFRRRTSDVHPPSKCVRVKVVIGVLEDGLLFGVIALAEPAR